MKSFRIFVIVAVLFAVTSDALCSIHREEAAATENQQPARMELIKKINSSPDIKSFEYQPRYFHRRSQKRLSLAGRSIRALRQINHSSGRVNKQVKLFNYERRHNLQKCNEFVISSLNRRIRRNSELFCRVAYKNKKLGYGISLFEFSFNLAAIAYVESEGNPRAVSPKGAKGVMQLMPGTAKQLGVEDSFDPEDNINGGGKYFAWLLSRHKGNIRNALIEYNAGPRGLRRPCKETEAYVRLVSLKAKKIRREFENKV